MNGGVSLAVWMGGVSHEINRTTQGAAIYGRLLEMTASKARVDVISGTSAGGINGAFLALAQTHAATLSSLRGTWLQSGALDQLLRDPYQKDPNSLLRGNEYFLLQLREAFKRIKDSGTPQSSDQVPMELGLTTTLLHGEMRQVPDDFGTLIADVNHRGSFTFRRGPDIPKTDDFADSIIHERLAFASRATASFPIAFEPLYCPIGPEEPPKIDGIIRMNKQANFTHNRYLLDGGILDNKPFEFAIKAVFRQRAEAEVRRVLCYVIPAPGETANDENDDPKTPPSLGAVAMASLVTLPSVQSISAQLESVVEHNRTVRRKRQTRVALAKEVGWAGVEIMAAQLFGVYRERRLESAADYIVGEISQGIIVQSGGKSALGRRRREWLTGVLSMGPDVPWVPTALAEVSRATTDPLGWNWGAFTLENIGDVLLDVLRRGFQLTDVRDTRRRQQLRELRKAAYNIVMDIPGARDQDRGFWRTHGARLQAQIGGLDDPNTIAKTAQDWAQEVRQMWVDLTVGLSPSVAAMVCGSVASPRVSGGLAPRQSVLAWLALAASQLIANSAALLKEIAVEATARKLRPYEQEAALDLHALVEFLAPADGRDAAEVQIKLLTLDVVTYAIASQRSIPDQFVELLQVSADIATAFGGPSRARDKLAGAQLANFAGFYKKAWRANDWMFGRLDGAERMLRILLNPARFSRLYGMRTTPSALMRELFLIAVPQIGDADRDDYEFLADHWDKKRAAVERELAFLTNVNYPMPEQLSHTLELFLPRVQLAILRDELFTVAAACEDDIANGAAPTGFAAQFLRDARHYVVDGKFSDIDRLKTKDCVALFLGCAIGQERFDNQVGSDLFTKTVIRTLAIFSSAMASKGSGLGILRRAIQVVRMPALILDALAQSIVLRSRSSSALFVAVLTASALIVALGWFSNIASTLNLGVAIAATLLVIASGALLLRKSPRLVVWWFLITLVISIVHLGPAAVLKEIKSWGADKTQSK